MIRINYLANSENNDLRNIACHAVNYERYDMDCTILSKSIEGCDRTVRKDSSTPAEITLAKEKKKNFEKTLEETKKAMSELQADHDLFVNTVTSASNDYTSNSIESVRNVLRLSACADNSRYFNIAIVSNIDNDYMGKFYEAFKACHEYDAICDTKGRIININAVNDAYNRCSKLLLDETKGALRLMFSIPVENEYTKKVTVRFNSSDLKHLHECFVRDIEILTTKNRKTGEVRVDGAQYRYAIKKTVKKDADTPTYEGATFKGLIAKLAFVHLFG